MTQISYQMKKLTFTLLLLLSVFIVFPQAQYSRVKLFASREEIELLVKEGVGIDHGIFRPGAYTICELSDAELSTVRESGISYEVIIEDVEKFYRERNEPFMDRLSELKEAEYLLSRDWPIPDGFELGSCGGFLTIDQCMEHLDNMAVLYPDLITQRAPLSEMTHNNRELYWVRLSDNPGTDEEDEPEVLYTGMHHAREGIGMQLLVYYMYYLLENYETDPEVQYIVDNFELYFVPIINPDGYAFNIQNQPAGGGMWRKNRRQNDDGSYGVDVNRNYGYMWGYDNNGSSGEPSDDTYRGPDPFSEPEALNMKYFCEDHDFRIALNYHSYSNLFLYPWGWTEVPCDHDAIFHAFGEIMTKENGYVFGAGSTTIYPTNGGSDDWMYGEQETKSLIYSYTPEVGDGSAGFWPPVSQIIPLCQENMYANIMAARLSGPYATARDLSPSIIEYKTGLIFFEIQRLGLEDGATYTVSVEPLNDAFASISGPFTYTDLEILETESAAFTYTLREDILDGDAVEFLLSVNNGLATFSDTIRKIYGTPVIIFEDDAESFTKWTSNKWNITTAQYHSPERSIADSPFGQYTNNENNIVTLVESIDLSDVVYASLGFWAKWDIEADYDYVQVLISDNNGGSWTPVQGKFTRPGSSNQELGEPLYDGVKEDWVREEINLSAYLDKQIKIRFVLRSDTYVTGDGFFWDDMTVTVVDQATGISSDSDLPKEQLISIQPNPSSETVTITLFSDKIDRLMIYNSLGVAVHKVRVAEGDTEIKLDVSGWPSGIYFNALESGSSIVAIEKLVVR